MIYPQNFEEKTGFDQVRKKIREHCLSSLGVQHIDRIAFSVNQEKISNELGLTGEFRRLLLSGEVFPSQDYYDLIPGLNRIRIPGTFMELEKMPEFRLSLMTIRDIIAFFGNTRSELYPGLAQLTYNITPCIVQVIRSIDHILDDKGLVRDQASPHLYAIRKEMQQKTAFVRKKILQLFKTVKQSGWTPEDAEITIRDGRMVIPVHSAHKRKMPGFIHDESASGQTVYLEPTELFETNNDIRELEYAERREIIRILIEFSSLVRPDIDELIAAYEFLGRMDFLRAKARFAIRINAILPVMQSFPYMEWYDAFHPLLYLSHESQGKVVVPQTIRMDDQQRILVISGPNAGGKSVCLKTAGLLQYMFQCGLLVPVNEQSVFGLFENIFIDIGDQQSLENDLSTYSSHLLNLKFFLQHSGKSTLFLIDEFGTGTDPALGGAIAEAALEELSNRRAFGIVTTHYSNLKLLQGKLDGIINGAMLFDIQKLIPLYRLSTGKPGSSFAFEIARKIGFPEDILLSAATKKVQNQVDFDRQLQNLEVDKEETRKKETELRVADELLKELTDRYEAKLREIQDNRKAILDKAKEEARILLENSNKIIERTIREIKEQQASKETTRKARTELEQFAASIDQPKEIPPRKKEKKAAPLPMPAKVQGIIDKGDFVRIKHQDAIGQVIAVKGKEMIIAFGGVQVKSSISQIEKMEDSSAKVQREQHRGSINKIIQELNEKAARFSLTLDIRGKRAEEALSLVSKYVDDAILLSVSEVKILHGKGDGILRRLIREQLSRNKEVRSYRDENVELGGSGITIIQLK